MGLGITLTASTLNIFCCVFFVSLLRVAFLNMCSSSVGSVVWFVDLFVGWRVSPSLSVGQALFVALPFIYICFGVCFASQWFEHLMFYFLFLLGSSIQLSCHLVFAQDSTTRCFTLPWVLCCPS